MRIVLLLVALLTAGRAECCSAQQPESSSATEEWGVMYFGEQRIGHTHTTTTQVNGNGESFLQTVIRSKMSFKRFGQTITIQTLLRTVERPNGDLVSFLYEMKNPPANSSQTSGTVANGKLTVTSITNGTKSSRVLPWEQNVKSPLYQDRVLQVAPLQPKQRVTIKTFVPDLLKITDVELLAGERENVVLQDGKKAKLLKVRITQSALPGIVTSAFVDTKGEVWKSETPMLGTVMISYRVPKAVALETLTGEEIDVAVQTLVKVKPIPNAHRTSRVVYLLKSPAADLSSLPVGETQSLKKLSDTNWELQVTSRKLPATGKFSPAPQEFLASTRFLQCGDQKVIQHAQAAAGDETDPAKLCLLMERYVNKKLSKKNFSTALASAAEVAQNLEGDCTEHAVLLAAMLRVKKVPTRIAVGLVYVPSLSAFGGHMWTEAMIDGKWYPLDATLGKGGIGAGHIKMAQSSFGDDSPTPASVFLPLVNMIGSLKVEVMSVE